MIEVLSLKVENEQLDKGSVEITKVDKDSQKALEGVVFEVQDDKGKVVTEVKTDKNGKAKNLRLICRKVQISRDEELTRLQKVNGTSIIRNYKRYDESFIIESRERTVR